MPTIMGTQMEKKKENEMEILGPFKGCRVRVIEN